MSATVAAPPSLTITFENSKPVELADLTVSLQAVARRYARFVAQHDHELEDENVKLYVRRITEGSIVVDLTNFAVAHGAEFVAGITGAGAGAAAGQANAIVSFAKNIRDGLNYLSGRGEKAEALPAAELKDLAKIVEPVAKDNRGALTINASDGAHVQVSVTYNSLEANTIQNRAEREIQERLEPIQKTFRRVLMYWHQASRGTPSRSDKAVIDSISDRPLKVVFDDDDVSIKGQMISGRDNPFTIGFLVDVELLTIRSKPAAYKVTHLYEVLDGEPDDIDD